MSSLWDDPSLSLMEKIRREAQRRSAASTSAVGVPTVEASLSFTEKAKGELIRRSHEASRRELTPDQIKATLSGPRIDVRPEPEPAPQPEPIDPKQKYRGPFFGSFPTEEENAETRQGAKVFLKSAAGVIPSIVAGQSTGGTVAPVEPTNPALVELARGIVDRTPNLGLQDTGIDRLTNRAAEAIAISPEEEEKFAVQMFLGQIAGSVPLALVGPQITLENIVATNAYKQLAQRVGARAALAMAENLPQIVQQNLRPDITQDEFFGNVANQLVTVGLAGGALESVAGARTAAPEAKPTTQEILFPEPARTPEGAFGQNVRDAGPDLDTLLRESERLMSSEQLMNEWRKKFPTAPQQVGENGGLQGLKGDDVVESIQKILSDTESVPKDLPVWAKPPDTEAGVELAANGGLSWTAKAGGGHSAKPTKTFHRKQVEQALKNGEAVPDEVLALYPDLQMKPKDAKAWMAAAREEFIKRSEAKREAGKVQKQLSPAERLEKLTKGVDPESPQYQKLVNSLRNHMTPEEFASIQSQPTKATETLSMQQLLDQPLQGGGMPGRQIPIGEIPKMVAGEQALGSKTNIRLDKFEDANLAVEQRIRQEIENTASIHGSDVIKARRGKISVEETEAQAQLMGADANELKRILSQSSDVALNETEIRAIGNVLHSASKNLADVSDSFSAGKASIEDMKQAMMLQHAAQMRAHAAWATAGRTLRQLRDPMRGLEVGNFEKLLQDLEDPATAQGFAQQVSKAYRSGGVSGGNSFLKNSSKANFLDKLFEYRIGSMLSLGYGQLRNFASNTAFGVKLAEEEFTAAGVEALRTGFGVLRPREITFSDAAHNAVGMIKGLRAGWNLAWKTMRTENSSFNEFLRSKGSSAQAAKAPMQKAIQGKTGEVIRFGTRVMQAQDDFNKGVLYSGKISELAHQQARIEGRAGDSQYIQQLIANPPPHLVDEAARFADVGTFTNRDGMLTEWANSLRRVKGMRWVVPFANTNSNILSRSAERLPGAGFVSAGVEAVRGTRGAELSRAIARPVLPTVASLIFADLVMDGTITGGKPTPESSDKSSDQFSRAAGWQPYSVRVGDRYVSIRSFAPMSNTVAAMADLALAYQAEEDEHQIAILTKHLRDVYARESIAGDLDEFLGMVLDPQNAGARTSTMTGQAAASFIPFSATSGAVARTLDDSDRDTRGFAGQVMGQLPLLRESVPVKEDAFGRPMSGRTGSGFLRTSQIDDAEMSTLLRAEKLAGIKRTLPDEGRPGDEDPKVLMERFARARKTLEDFQRTTRGEKIRLSKKEREPADQERRELLALQERLYKGELHQAALLGDRKRFMQVWKEAHRSGFRIANGEPGDFWKQRRRE